MLTEHAEAPLGGSAVASSLELFCSAEEHARWDDRLTETLLAARKAVAAGRVTPAVATEELRRRLDFIDFQAPRPLADVIGFVIEQLEGGLVQIAHPRYFGLFNPAPSLPAELADRIANAFNPQLATATTSPAAVEIERHVVRAFARRIGFPATAGGHFATGGSEANCAALISALTFARGDYVGRGLTAFAARPVFYVSEEAHLAWFKIAVQSGIGHEGVRAVPADGHGRMDADALDRLIARDRERGSHPVMLSATAGTTGAGMIDPLGRCADIAERHGLWYHVDAAWGGAAVVSERMRGLLEGIERAHSVTIDAHKWLATTMACSLFLTRLEQPLREAFRVESHFMPPSDETVDPYLTTAQWSRRFMGLRLFLALSSVGWEGYAAHVERGVETARRISAGLVDLGWRIANESPLAVICAVPPEGSPPVAEVVRRVLSSGRAWVSATRFRGQEVIRICPASGRTTEHDVSILMDALREALGRVGRGRGE